MVKKTGRPGYLQIADDLREQIRGGSLPPGAPLPSTAQLATRYDASLSVVKLAVGILRNEGLVIGQQGKGVFVREDVPDAAHASADLASEVIELRTAVRDLSERLARVEATLSQRSET
ncbi:winged helix-turn-helix transcriptional regulator [Microbispora sp. SCL1-1]|uniref:winged helix-turn-helix domain-containing protein n=1 Tax=unclassified Microbispora TaxID=2614687 RepID=UPI00115A1EB5|nr:MULTISPECIES: winged helix-turn-helix domain-containing protein [unclassified Microbispora]NJP30220.1 winged helix-turn-helix transcriptional regulator [Microbispora sp. CL1-1]TQS02402.1 winged helix-turn-helix transcriptional regulator [Microbispora sp. SCL1-1]